ncbi:MAG: hypothetical protein HZA04_07700 [Nitrospinae bacterium]|nr:hypothetical protein [Nitrospinota bacterium]
MSIILDALRKVEQDKRLQKQPQIDIKQRLLHDRKPGGGVLPFTGRVIITCGLVALTAGVLYGSYALLTPGVPRAEAVAVQSAAPVTAKPSAPQVRPMVVVAPAEEHVIDLTAVNKTPIAKRESREPMGRGIEKERRPEKQMAMGRKQADKRAVPQYADEEEVSQETAARPVRREPMETAGIEPSARRTPAQAAPAPSVVLDGIIYHAEPDKRSALLRLRGQSSSSLVKIGDPFAGLKVESIEQSRVALSGGAAPVELKLE